METIKNILTRLGPTGGAVLSGLIVIIYISLGFLFFQQGVKQRQHTEQIVKLSAIIARPLPSAEELQTEYDACNRSLAPMPDSDAIALLVSIAEQSGIDISEDIGEFRVPPATHRQEKVGENIYQTISFRNIHVQGSYDDVMAFISILDSGEILETLVLKTVITNQVIVTLTGEERDRRAEFSNVKSAVEDMMMDNNLLVLPNPMRFAGGIATNFMGDSPDTEGTTEGFPDITTTAAEKGYSGIATPSDGYVLYRHDRISEDDSTQYETVSYLPTLSTTYYYTCEADGTVRQWGGPNVATAREYLSSGETKIEIKAAVDVDIYTKVE